METRFCADDDVELVASVFGGGPVTVVFCAGIADRMSVRPVGEWLARRYRVALPDLRGVGASRCADPGRHGWSRYIEDLAALLDHLGVDRAVVAGAGMGSTIALRAGRDLADRLQAVIAAGVEALEVDDSSAAWADAAAFFPSLASEVEQDGLAATWARLLPNYPPFIRVMVTDSVRRADPASAAAIFRMLAHDKAFGSVADLAAISVPTLVIPANDPRHPAELAIRCARVIPHATLAGTVISNDLADADEYAAALAPAIVDFVERTVGSGAH
jgi:pimeloyl-ACP methyl ester carboxylesterase